MKTPKCPKCGFYKFREYQTCTERQTFWFNEDGETDYGESEFCSVDTVDQLVCDNCEEDVTLLILNWKLQLTKKPGKVTDPLTIWRNTWPILKEIDAKMLNSLEAFHGHVEAGMDWLNGWSQGPAWEHAIAALVAVRLGCTHEANDEIIEAQRHENGELGSD